MYVPFDMNRTTAERHANANPIQRDPGYCKRKQRHNGKEKSSCQSTNGGAGPLSHDAPPATTIVLHSGTAQRHRELLVLSRESHRLHSRQVCSLKRSFWLGRHEHLAKRIFQLEVNCPQAPRGFRFRRFPRYKIDIMRSIP